MDWTLWLFLALLLVAVFFYVMRIVGTVAELRGMYAFLRDLWRHIASRRPE